MDYVDRTLVLDERVARPLERVLPRRARELRDGLPAVLRAVTRARDDDPVPRTSGLGLFIADALSYRGIAQPLGELRGAALVHPVRIVTASPVDDAVYGY